MTIAILLAIVPVNGLVNSPDDYSSTPGHIPVNVLVNSPGHYSNTPCHSPGERPGE